MFGDNALLARAAVLCSVLYLHKENRKLYIVPLFTGNRRAVPMQDVVAVYLRSSFTREGSVLLYSYSSALCDS